MRARAFQGIPVILACLASLLALAPAAAAKSYDHPLIEQTFRLLPDGDAVVEEVRAFDFEGSFSWAEITRSTRGQYGRYAIDYEGVWDADTKQPLRSQVTRSGDDITFRWSYQAQDETKRFLLRYRIRRAVQRYQDVAQFYWQAVEGDHAPIGRVRITIEPPRPSPRLFKVFIHSRAAPGGVELRPGLQPRARRAGQYPRDELRGTPRAARPRALPHARRPAWGEPREPAQG